MQVFFALVGVPIWPSVVVGVRAGGFVAWQSPTTSRVHALFTKASYVVGVAVYMYSENK